MIKFSRASIEDIPELLENLREVDKGGFFSVGFEPTETLTQMIKRSVHSVTVRVDGQICCVWGITGASLMGGHGLLWMLTTNEADKHRRQLARLSREGIEQLLKMYPKLCGLVDPKNKTALRWLSWLGFTFTDEFNCQGCDVIYFERFR